MKIIIYRLKKYILLLLRIIKILFFNLVDKKLSENPLMITIFLTSKCSYQKNCQSCWRPEASKKNKEISLDNIYKISKMDAPLVLLSGGEPTEHSKFGEILKVLEDKTVFIFTNGTNSKIIIDSVKNKLETKIIVGIVLNAKEELINSKIDFIKHIHKHELTIYTNIIIDKNDTKSNKLFDLVDKLSPYINRVYLTNYIVNNCTINKASIKWIRDISLQLRNYTNTPIIISKLPNKFSIYSLNILSKLSGGKAFVPCSGFPYKVYINEDGIIGDCPHVQERIKKNV